MKSKKTLRAFWLTVIILAYVLVGHVGSSSQFPSERSPVKCETMLLAQNGIQIGAP